MKLTVCNTGSSGNGYILDTGTQVLLIEAGCPFKEIKRLLDFNIMNIKGMCVSHTHGDHYKYKKEYETAGISIYEPWKEQGVKHLRFGDFTVQSFGVIHDVPCYGFYIREGDERIVFATDAEYIPVRFDRVKPTTLMVECNYQDKYVSDVKKKRDRVYQTHMELETTKDFVKANATENLRNVILLHMSDGSADVDEMVSEVKSVVDADVNVIAAKRGLVVDLKDWRDM